MGNSVALRIFPPKSPVMLITGIRIVTFKCSLCIIHCEKCFTYIRHHLMYFTQLSEMRPINISIL